MFPEALPENVWKLLLGLSGLGAMRSSYLAGGTALPIQLGHRISADLDFFSPEDPQYTLLLDQMLKLGISALVIAQTPRHWELIVENVKVDFLREILPLKFPLITVDCEGGRFQMADVKDIGLVKMHSIAGRGAKKDFFDLYCLTRSAVSLEELLELIADEYARVRFNKLLFLKGLIDFEEADRDAEPVMLWKVGWEQVKKELTEEVKKVGLSWA
jgi:hypothetical protein